MRHATYQRPSHHCSRSRSPSALARVDLAVVTIDQQPHGVRAPRPVSAFRCPSTALLQPRRCAADVREVKVLALRRPGVCGSCCAALEPGTRAACDGTTRTVRCLGCAEQQPQVSDVASLPHDVPPADQPPDGAAQVAGASAQREYDRRSQRRADAVRARHPRLGRLILALADEPAHTRVWAQGARGERAVAAELDELAGEHVAVLHDRAVRRPDGRVSRANTDHLAVAAAGVWVVDAKTHQGALEVRRSGGLFCPWVEKLYIAGRDQTALLDGLAEQVEAVTAVLAEVDADVPVRGALCFVGTQLPWFGDSIRGVPLLGRRGLGKLLKQPGDLQQTDREALATYLASRLPAAA